jgi:excisionase family DNA binding protein
MKEEQLLVTMTVKDLKSLIHSEVQEVFNEYRPATEEKKQEAFLTREETAKALKISLPTLSALSKQGAIPSYRLRGRVLYKAAEVALSLIKVDTGK